MRKNFILVETLWPLMVQGFLTVFSTVQYIFTFSRLFQGCITVVSRFLRFCFYPKLNMRTLNLEKNLELKTKTPKKPNFCQKSTNFQLLMITFILVESLHTFGKNWFFASLLLVFLPIRLAKTGKKTKFSQNCQLISPRSWWPCPNPRARTPGWCSSVPPHAPRVANRKRNSRWKLDSRCAFSRGSFSWQSSVRWTADKFSRTDLNEIENYRCHQWSTQPDPQSRQ